MKTIAVILGVVSLFVLFVHPVGLIGLLLGLLLFLSSANAGKRALDERRHHELLDAMKQSQQK